MDEAPQKWFELKPILATGIPDLASTLIVDHIESVEQLEVLLLLHRSAPRVVKSSEAASELRIDGASAQRRMEDLVVRGLLEGEADGFVYRPGNSRDGQVRSLAEAYRERRVSVITLIFSKPQKAASDPARALADAFRLKRGPKDG